MTEKSQTGLLERFTQARVANADLALERDIAESLSWLEDGARPERLKRLAARHLGNLAWPLRSPGESAESRKTCTELRARAVAGLERALREELSTLVRADAVNALVKLQRDGAADVLMEVLSTQPPLPVQRAILGHLVRFRDARALEPLVGLTRWDSVTTRRWAVRRLGELGNPNGRAAVVEAKARDAVWRRPLYWRASWRTRQRSRGS